MKLPIALIAIQIAGQIVFGPPITHRNIQATEWRTAVVEHMRRCHPDAIVISRFPEIPSASRMMRERADEIDACDLTLGELRKLLFESETQ